MRNREIQWYLLTMLIISTIAIILGAFVSLLASLLIFLTCISLIGSSLLFTRWRYSELEKLSGYLRRTIGGDFSLDIRDNREGELSILKNDIYKVTQMLSEQGSLLQRDKVHLTNAISDIAHQLKTPLTSMVVITDLLSHSNLPDDRRVEFTHKIRVQLERIEWLVSSLLKLSKIDAGTVHFKKEQVVVSELIRKAVEPVLIPMDIKGQSLLINGEDTVTFVGDLNWTAEAIINILKNCLEHTPEGGEIEVCFSENTLLTKIVIRDNGKGIKKEDLPYIFKRFYKGKNAGEDSVGIGLAMSHSIITSQNGDIEVKSKLDEGTEFYIKFYKQII